VAAGAFGFLIFSHAFDGPDSLGDDPRRYRPTLPNHQIGEQTSQRRSNWQSASVHNGDHLYVSPAQAGGVSRGAHGNHT
jgi:hypothetical protein